MGDSILDQIQEDTKAAMRAGEKDRTVALRMIASEVQKAAKEGDGDAVAVLQRERKKRIEAAEAYAAADRGDQAEAERIEAALIETYLPEQLSEAELAALVEEAVGQSGASSMQDMGRVMGIVMPKVKGRADGNRVSALVREQLGA
jgi:uncharacterized protein YqeY